MLQELTIKDFAIISDLNLSFYSGMTVLTGETGAGKSIIIDAVGLLAGGRGSADFVRQGAERSVLEGQFFVGPKLLGPLTEELATFGIEIHDGVVIVSRMILKNGKNVCRVNNHLVNIQVLKRIGHFLVDIHGQHEHQELMKVERHLDFLDQFGQEQVAEIKDTYQEIYHRYQVLTRKLKEVRTNEKENAQRMDMLTFQKQEISDAKLQVGEEKQLEKERQWFMNYQKISDALSSSYEALQGNEFSSLSQIGLAMDEMDGIQELNQEYQHLYEEIASSYYQLEEASRSLKVELDSVELDESRVNFVEERLNLIRQLKRKYGDSEEAILSHYERVVQELDATLTAGDQLEQLADELDQVEEALQKAADQLTEVRKITAKKMEQEIIAQLKDLYLEKTVFEVKFQKKVWQRTGQDDIEFFISTNPGEPTKPLVKVASGGELSRVMLAMKSLFSESQGITSIVFDEVDTGVSGRVAQAIAEKIHYIATNSQVLCITHLPQVAAAADHQYFIEKEVVDQRTETKVGELNQTERVEEIARMLAGEVVTDLSRQHAFELLKLSK
ncbi:DNA repair protein RecN [Vagococcus elongatus]|uniref:DNA repair protein RecN n=1 Tax=Vagococcus elongatus TaxID=180344 RepID=A0A430AYC5_9ENTE|nr:DNA repair protein RecN [Vagococcus elongatus]RSU13049.1 DNA repair protein RecN [Vagococcus elongatus]